MGRAGQLGPPLPHRCPSREAAHTDRRHFPGWASLTRLGPGVRGGPRPSQWGAPRLAGGGVTSHPGRRGHRRDGNLSVANSRGFLGHFPGRLWPAVGALAAAAPEPSWIPLSRTAPVDALVKRLELP